MARVSFSVNEKRPSRQERTDVGLAGPYRQNVRCPAARVQDKSSSATQAALAGTTSWTTSKVDLISAVFEIIAPTEQYFVSESSMA